MAMTLVEAAKHSNDVLQAGIIEKLVYQDPLLERLGFIEIPGNGLTYDVEATLPDVNFYSVGDTWGESTHTIDQHTAVLKILGGDADVDNFLKATRSNVMDLEVETIDMKVKAVKKKFTETAIYGYSTGNSKSFDGLHYMIRSSTSPYEDVVAVGASETPAALSLMKVEEAVDMVKGFSPALILMSKQMRRYINKYLRGTTGITSTEIQGMPVQTLCDIPVAVSDYIGNDESCDLQYGTLYGHNYADGNHGVDDDGATSIFILCFEPKAFVGVTNGGLQIERLGSLETMDAARTRIKWYVSVMLQSIISCAKVTGIDADGTVTA